MHKRNYFPHIDGLRGIAVLLVLLFHLDITVLKGGFIGVDVFFVISGYLISSILIPKIDQKDFSFKEFYFRRIKRLMPSMLFVVILTLLMAYFVYPLFLFEKTLKSSTATVLSFSNVYFFLESGYFDSSSYIKPLLHTWSLSVEEQFYLIWPFLLFFTLKIKKTVHRVLVLSSFAVISFFFSEYYLTINSSAAFFLTPFRVFEFLIGTLLFWTNKFEFKSYAKESLSLIGITGLIFLASFYDNKVLFPGINALLPCLFSAILIHNTGQTKYVSRIYNNQLIRWLGRISYSLYLIHWPFVVFYKHLYGPNLNPKDQIILFFSAIVVGFIIYKCIETPFRVTKRKESKIIILIFTTMVLILVTNYCLLHFESFFFKNTTTKTYGLKQIEEGKNLRFQLLSDTINDLNLKNTKHTEQVLILGDSHAPDALNFLKLAYPNYDYRMLSEGGCPPMVSDDLKLINNHPPEMKDKCYVMMDKIYRNNFLSKYEYIVINVMFGWYKPENLVAFVKEIKKKTKAKIIVFGNYIVLKRDMPEITGSGETITNKDIESFGLYDNELKIKSKGLYQFISKKELLSNGNNLKDCVLFTAQNAPMSYDSNHLSFEFSKTISDSLRIKKINIFKKK
ncbi:acyltransferase family protein [Flavobacterium flavigenum]|uniref:acyltransferase family protein n=1 Tax=Flavobacterium flavigenum TaxID=3003258 RepID=UPI0024830E67|nr:acyltransferase [Flavobacterium flavigenum]